MTSSDQSSDRDRILETTDLVSLIGESVSLRPKGREHVGLCPFHNDSSPSMAVVTHKGNAFYNCFACGASGNAIDFMMRYHRMDFPDALRFLAMRAGIELTPRGPAVAKGDPASPDMLRRANDAALRFFRRTLMDATLGGASRSLFTARGISDPVSEQFCLGAAPSGGTHLVNHVDRLVQHASEGSDQHGSPQAIRQSFETAGLLRRGRSGLQDSFRNRAMFPILDELGRCIAFGARKIDPEDEPKYLNSPESNLFHKSRSLYAINLAKRSIMQSRTAIVVEGYTDAIACHQAGLTNVVATLGTALTRDHARVLARLCDRVVLLFDGDEAGRRAADRALDMVFAEPLDVSIASIPGGLDPDELLAQSDGKAQFDAVIESAVDSLSHLAASFKTQIHAAPGAGARQRVIEALMARLSQIGLSQLPPLRRALLLTSISKAAQVPVATLEATLPKSQSRTAAPSEDQMQAPLSAAEPLRPTIASTAVERARLMAEHSFLALLLGDPSIAGLRVTSKEGDSQPLSEAFPPHRFLGVCERAAYAAIHDRLESGQSWSVQSLLADISDGATRTLLISLFDSGTRRLEQGSAAELLAVAASDLESLWSQTDQSTNSSLGLGAEAAQARLDSIRARGPRPTAVPRGTAIASDLHRA
ncbi:MAG: DNA primase [Phycisphaerales bacterium]|nr:DNA primase [Phycisphaerales bacterium]